jgi:transposase
MHHQKSIDYKETAVNYYLVEDKTQEEVCKIFNCSRRSLMRWVKQHENEGKIKGYERKPKAYKVHKEYVDFLLQEIKKNKTITIDDLLYLLKNKYPDAQLSQSHLHRIIRDNNITLKLTRIRHEPVKRFGKDIDINNNLKDFYNEIKQHNIEDIICIDETSIKSLQKRNHCYSGIGKRCVIKTQILTSLHNNFQEHFIQHFLQFVNKTTNEITQVKATLFQFKKQLLELNETDEIFSTWKLNHLSNILPSEIYTFIFFMLLSRVLKCKGVKNF